MLRVHRDFKGLLKDVQDEYDFLAELNKSLQKKVAEWNKDEEIQRAVEMTEYCRTHSLCQMSDNEKKAERAFRDSHYKSCKNGSKYLYELTGTGIGTAITIKCPYCESGTNDFVPMNQAVEYSGIEMAVNRQGMLRVRVLDDDGSFTTQDIIEIRNCPLCGKRFMKGRCV